MKRRRRYNARRAERKAGRLRARGLLTTVSALMRTLQAVDRNRKNPEPSPDILAARIRNRLALRAAWRTLWAAVAWAAVALAVRNRAGFLVGLLLTDYALMRTIQAVDTGMVAGKAIELHSRLRRYFP